MKVKDVHPQFDVGIVGAGFAGMYLLHRCRTLGLTARVWEAGGGVGGTWYWNRYPGARCDVESLQYSYQFDDDLQQEWEWSERYSAQPEILQYAEHVAKRFNLKDGIEFNRRVETAEFVEAENLWTLSTESGETLTARICVMATGCLSAPNWPMINGFDQFSGDVYHTALWPHEEVDLTGKRAAVLGTGSSAVQSIPHIAEQAEFVTVFQRTPNYAVPAQNAPLEPAHVAEVKARYPDLRSNAKKKLNGIDGTYNTNSALSVSHDEREAEYERRWQNGGLTFMGSYGDFLTNKKSNDSLAQFVRAKIKSIVKDQDVAELLCPDNIIGGKRLCVEINYYKTYNRDNIRLIDLKRQPITEINSSGIITSEGQHEVDVIVVATGFDAMTGSLTRMDIRGRNSISLRDQWKSGPTSYLGLAMADFPNLFTVTGPGSPSVLTNMLPTLEHHVVWISDCIKHMHSNGYQTVDVQYGAQQDWWQHVQEVGSRGLKQTTASWYTGENVEGKARVFLPYIGGFPAYIEKCQSVIDNDYEGFSFSKA